MLGDLGNAIKALASGRLGDAGVYKSLVLGVEAAPGIQADLASLAAPLPVIRLSELRALPPESFGRAYAEHMDRLNLMPLNLSESCRQDLIGRPILGPRYTLFHDAFHVLLGCDTSLEGECEVWAFVAAQNYAPALGQAGKVSWITYTLARPWRWRGLRDAYRRGLARGETAAKLLVQPLEQLWAQPLARVRAELGLA